MSWIRDELHQLTRDRLMRRRRGTRVHRAGREFVRFASNDYLDLARDPRLAEAAIRAARRHGTGAGASPLVSGHSVPLQRLERDLASWEGHGDALVFSSGYAANVGVIGALAGSGDAIFSDEWNHASLIDGCRLSRATTHVYPHGDLDGLERLLRGTRARRRLIVSDTVFSMDGDVAPLDDLLDIAHRHECMVLIDEAHATGVLGDNGRGVTDLIARRLEPTDHFIKVGTLSKALGSQGGFVCGTRPLVRYLLNKTRSYIFSTALAPTSAAAASRALRIVREEPSRRGELARRAERLRGALRELDLNIGNSTTQIVPIIVGSPDAALEMSAALKREGLIVPAIRPPSVPAGASRLRVSVTCGHSDDDIDRLIAAIKAHLPLRSIP